MSTELKPPAKWLPYSQCEIIFKTLWITIWLTSSGKTYLLDSSTPQIVFFRKFKQITVYLETH